MIVEPLRATSLQLLGCKNTRGAFENKTNGRDAARNGSTKRAH